jgi:hypothetical protein
MDSINKLLVALVFSAIIGICYVAELNLRKDELYNERDVKITTAQDIALTQPLHPYNQCVKLLIDQANKESKKFSPEETKSLCFDLLNDPSKQR